jgi:hypothetical protein
VILKYRADLCYRRQQLDTATSLYLGIIEVLPPSNRVVHREVKDSLTRCYLGCGEFRNALRCAEELVAPPHDNDASSWHLLALCYKGLGDDSFEDYILCLQKCNLLQRYNTTTWLELAHAYPTLSTKSIFSNTDVTSEMFAAILGNTVTLFRPYFKWTNGKEKLEISREIETSTRLLGRQLSVEEFLSDLIQLPWKQREELLRVLFQMSSCCCLIWARQLQIYSARHCGSFAKQVQTEKLKQVEHLIGGCHDDLTCYLVQCFNQPAIFEENIADYTR